MIISGNAICKTAMYTLSLSLLLCAVPTVAAPLQKKPIVPGGLLLDLNADIGIVADKDGRIESWTNSIKNSPIKQFNKVDEGRAVKGSGRPALIKKLPQLNGHNTVQFVKQELLNNSETAFDSLNTGSGFTWIAVLRPYHQVGQLQDVNSFFGNLRNEGNYEGFWAGFTDDNRLWTGSRNGITFGRWDENNPCVLSDKKLDTTRYYLLAGRMQAGVQPAAIDLFIDDFSAPDVSGVVPVNIKADPSKLAIGQERDAIQHPGIESFIGEMARFMIYGRPLSNEELQALGQSLRRTYFVSQ